MSFPKKVVTTYAKSLFQNVKNAKPSKEYDVYIIGEELHLLSSAVLSTKKLTEFFKNPTYSEKQKLEILNTVFDGLSLPLKSFLKVLTERSHLSLLPEISDEYSKIIAEIKNYTRVKIVTASSLQESYGSLLFKTLKELTKSKAISLYVAYNPKLLGGLLIEYKSTLIDLSVLKEFSLFFNEV